MAADEIVLGTIYIVDLVGSTRLETSVGPVRADELRHEFFGLLREAIGTSGGSEVKSTGDGLMVAFGSASAAVGCAVLTQQLFERRYRGAEQPLHIRIGLGTGESLIQGGDYYGMPAIEATRLCGRAPTGGILVTPATRMLAGRVDGARFRSFGELKLKGIPEPMEAFEVLWEPLDPERAGAGVGRWPLPEALRAVPRIAFVGRVSERGLIEHARERARRSASRQMMTLSGEPGIGKTRLASYAALGANADGFAVAWGACSEDLAVPYEPWIDVCTQLVEHAPDDVLAEYLERSGGGVRRLAGNLDRRLPGAPAPQSSDPETERFLLFRAVAELLRAVAASVPLCVVLDDFHWADGQSVALLKHVARTVEHGALQLVVTYRDSDLTKDHALTAALADLRRLEGAERIALSGLGADEVAELLSAGAGHELDADGLALAGELATETGGNPFFVGEILRNLIEAGALTFDEAAGRWNVDLAAVSSMPESVREVIERRIGRLGEDGREALTVAAVIGRSFDLRLLTEVVEIAEGRLLDQLETAVGAALLRESADQVGRFTFEHALINHTLYQGLGGTRRARLHHRVALALEALYPDQLADLALHWRLATVAMDTTKAADYSLRAGRRALDGLAPSEAARLFTDALDLLGPGEGAERCDALIGLGEAQRLTGDATHRETLLEASRIASALGDGPRAARAALANSRGQSSVYGRVDRERVAAIERAIELDDDPHRRARLLSRLASDLLYDRDYRRRDAIADQALALAREVGDPNTMAYVIVSCMNVCFAPYGTQRRRALLDEWNAAGSAVDDPALAFWLVNAEINTFAPVGELERVDDARRRMTVIAERLGEPTMHWQVAYNARACTAMLRGDLPELERWAARALEVGGEAGEPDAVMIYGGQLVLLRILQGRAGEVVGMLQAGVKANPLISVWKATLAWTLCWLDRRDEAAAIVATAAADGFEHLPREHSRGTALAAYADAAAQCGVTGAAEILYELIEPWADQVAWNGVSAGGLGHTYLGLLAAALGRDEQADRHFARATEVQERGGMLVWAARAHLGWAEALSARGEDGPARERAARALELARAHGYGFIEPRAAAILEGRPSATRAS